LPTRIRWLTGDSGVSCAQMGATLEQDGTMGAVESVKAASDVYAPVSGTVTEVNGALNDEPGLVNTAAESDGWMCKIKMSKPDEVDSLMVRGA
jgi:glycine cleavage system H protein